MWKSNKVKARRAFTLTEIIVGVALLTIVGAIVAVTVQKTSVAQSDQERLDEAAYNLDQLARAIAFFEPTKPPLAFRYTVGVYPSRLSHLTSPISTAQTNDCGVAYTAGQVAAWTGGYFLREIPTTNFKVAEGFIANDVMTRVPVNANAGLPAVLSIVMPNVDSADAAGLGSVVDNDPTGTNGSVRFTLNGNSPVTVSYRIEIGGC